MATGDHITALTVRFHFLQENKNLLLMALFCLFDTEIFFSLKMNPLKNCFEYPLNKTGNYLPTHVPPMWAYVHRDPMGSWQMARHWNTQMPTSYLAHLCQDKTHEAGRVLGERNMGRKTEERNTHSYTMIKMCLISKTLISSFAMSGTDTQG